MLSQKELKDDLIRLREQYPLKTHISCKICGKSFSSLTGHLRIHAVTPADYKKEYDKLFLTCDYSRQKHTQHNIITLAEQIWLKRHWGKNIFSAKGVARILNVRFTQLNSLRNLLALPRLIEWHSPYWSKKLIVRKIRERYEQELPLDGTTMRKADMHLIVAAEKYYRSWRRALLAARIDPAKVSRNRQWTKEKIIKYLRKWIRQGKSIKTRDIRKQDKGFHYAIRRYFRNMTNILSAAGLKQYLIRQTTWSKENIIDAIQKRAKAGKSLKLQRMVAKRLTSRLRSAAEYHFGSYANAIRAAGLDYAKIKIRNV